MPTAPTLTFAGAARGVTGSCYHLELDGFGLVIDCGVFQGRDGEAMSREPFAFSVRDVDAVVLTHGHLDHVGRLPRLAQQGFAGKVHGHPATLEIARLILEDGARIATYRRGEPLYGADDVAHSLSRATALPYLRETMLGPFRVRLFDAGHILGSASVRVAWDTPAGEKAILFSGDLGSHGAPILREPTERWDAERDAVDWVVTESTYGDSEHPERSAARAQFRDAVLRAISDGGKVLIPAFAVGRTQEVLYDLEILAESKKLPRVPVIVDGPLGIQMTSVYERHVDCWDDEALAKLRAGNTPLEFRDLYATRKAHESERIHDIDGPAIVIAGSGMCSGGRIVDHLVRYLPDPRTDLIFVGYQAEGTLGRALQRGEARVEIDGSDVDVRAHVTTIRGFSAHADRSMLARWLEGAPLRAGGQVFVTHGEPETAEAYARYVRDRFAHRTTVPALGESVLLG